MTLVPQHSGDRFGNLWGLDQPGHLARPICETRPRTARTHQNKRSNANDPASFWTGAIPEVIGGEVLSEIEDTGYSIDIDRLHRCEFGAQPLAHRIHADSLPVRVFDLGGRVHRPFERLGPNVPIRTYVGRECNRKSFPQRHDSVLTILRSNTERVL